MTGIVIVLHSLVCILLILIVLMQSGRGGGLTEGFASAENVFGTQTNALLIRISTILATVFFITCLLLAFLSAKKNQSLMANKIAPAAQTAPANDILKDMPPAEALTPVITNAQK